ncbi:sensor histidine kinase [Congregibacter sp.]|uniref:sensor histidine kinase n=1 Tax=Congregibacter sp. TaxID=2744308 RepID=UPI00385EA0AE
MKRFFESLTLLQLILLGFAAVILPLAIAIWIAIVRSEEFAITSRNAIVSVQSSTDASRQLASRINSVERSARQFFALEDLQIHAIYEGHRGDLLQLLNSMRDMPNVEGAKSVLADLRDADARLYRHISVVSSSMTEESVDPRVSQAQAQILPTPFKRLTGPSPSIDSKLLNPRDVEVLFDTLRSKSAELIALHSQRGRELSTVLTGQVSQLRNSLVLLAALVIPLSLILAAVFLVLIRRPLRELDSSIRTLGDGALAKPVRIGGARDLTELGQRLDWLRERLVTLESQKTRFLRDVSHELKTPLTNIREASELLLYESSESSETEVATITRILHDNGLRLQSLIEELLRFGAADRDSEHQPLALDTLIEAIVKRQAIAVQSRRLKLRLDLESVYIHANSRQIEIVVDNLLSNAIKFAQPGGSVNMMLKRTQSDVILDVKDDGPGVPKEHRQRIFEWFFRGSEDTQALVSGSGMGLAIADEYVRLHRGTLTLPACSTGTVFRLTLPALDVPQSPPDEQGEPTSNAPCAETDAA